MKMWIGAGFLALLAGSSAIAQEISLDAPGADDDLAGFLRQSAISLSLDDDDADPAPQDYVAAARADYRTLLTALYTRGYYGGVISIRLNGREAAEIAPLDAPGRIDSLAITVETGPQFTFSQARIAPVPPGAALPEGFAPGAPALSDVVRAASQGAIGAWRDIGHAKAEIAGQQIVARHRENVLDASVTVAPGPRLTFGPVTVTGNAAVRGTAIQNIAGLPVGAVFSPAELERAAQRLRQTGAFDSVSLTEAEVIAPGNTLPISLAVVEAKPRRIGFGIELSSVEGLRVSSYWMHRNAFGAAERFRVEGEVSGIGGETGGVDYRLATSLNIPAIYGPDTDLLFSASISREDEPDYLLDRAAVEILAVRQITDDLEASVGIGILTAREETDLGVREYTLLTLPLSATLDRRDEPANASNGYYIDVDATPFISLKGGDNGGRIFADGRVYRSFGARDRFTVAARAQVGSVIGPEIADTPADFLFYSGGGGTVRGQPYKDLGIDSTRGSETITTGGLSFAGAQLEARFDVTDNIGLVGFADYGHVGATSTPLESGDDHAGVGLGVRYNTGIGPIRLDIGTPATGDDAFGEVQVYIGIGQAF